MFGLGAGQPELADVAEDGGLRQGRIITTVLQVLLNRLVHGLNSAWRKA